MASVSRAFHAVEDRLGRSIGVLPGAAKDGEIGAPPGYPNPWIEIPIRTHLPLSGERGRDPMSRNHLNVLSAEVIVALPGGAGTRSEIELALEYGRPLICWFGDVESVAGLGSGRAPVAASFDELTDFIERKLPEGSSS
jgi:predicted Rossmann-fold nucleotide-binding protein